MPQTHHAVNIWAVATVVLVVVLVIVCLRARRSNLRARRFAERFGGVSPHAVEQNQTVVVETIRGRRTRLRELEADEAAKKLAYTQAMQAREGHEQGLRQDERDAQGYGFVIPEAT